MPRLLLALLGGSCAFAVTLASASALPIGGAGVGTGGVPMSPCDTAPIGVAYDTVFIPGAGYGVGSVTLTGVNTEACAGREAEVTLSDSQRAPLASGSAPVPAHGRTLVIKLGRTVPVQAVVHVDIAIG